ncbi:23S rRNA (pseudouridine(1915)-N(3))-methyltransferase RlmH [Sulfurivermis fontis]|jgi:23S rRNA (pseudouridine1915-N3)-methyltransferase|uniref:23S rRNA (pseudouridine(1915)-N(3))-methyltransferase RlmH n=1 Tax=Sulfurivermis fontis TaxID=1972068 RepID=UPI000FD90890|nr:23S rRNA (pseudouridine(1915)-N(3))-methyltransferase RlmH [Sulfurivermis fontis]
MRLHLIAVGNRMPEWVEAGYAEYAKRLPADCALVLHEIAPGKRTKGADLERARREEGEKMLAALPKGAYVVALEVGGKDWSTADLAQRLTEWRQGGRDVALLVGGPEGLADTCRARADVQWSLSRLTLPHPLVRIVLAEQLYRAWSITQGHPYHR